MQHNNVPNAGPSQKTTDQQPAVQTRSQILGHVHYISLLNAYSALKSLLEIGFKRRDLGVLR